MSEQPDDATPVPPRRNRGRQNALDMVRSMAVIVAFVAVVLLFAPQPDGVEQPTVDPTTAALVADGAAVSLGFDPLLLLPGRTGDDGVVGAGEGLPGSTVVAVGSGWDLDYARIETATDDIPTWRQGLLSPSDRRIDLEQAVDPSEEWLLRADEGRVGTPESVEVDGVTWSRVDRGDERTAYTTVLGGDGGPAVTTMLSATSDSEDLRTVVEAVAAALTS